jgi:hypothetical protein
MIGVAVRRGKALDYRGCDSRLGTGPLHTGTSAWSPNPGRSSQASLVFPSPS